MINFIEYINKVGPICRQLASLKHALAEQAAIPYELYKRLDDTLRGSITADDLHRNLGISMNNSRLIAKIFSEGEQGFKYTVFKDIIAPTGHSSSKSHQLGVDEVMDILKAVMQRECDYVKESYEIRRRLDRLDVNELLQIFQQFDSKNLYYIESKDIQLVLSQTDIEVQDHIQLVLQREFRFDLISFQEFLEFFRRNTELISLAKQECRGKDSKLVKFKERHQIGTPQKKAGRTSKKERSTSKVRTPKKYRTVSPKRGYDRTIDRHDNTTLLLRHFNPSQIGRQLKKTFEKYFRVYSVYK